MSLSHIFAIVGGLLGGAVVALRVIAPRTKTTVDDDVLKRLESLEAIVSKLPH